MAMISKVKRMFFREKKSVRQIVRLTSLSRNTVRKWLKAPVLEALSYRRSEMPGKLTPFHETRHAFGPGCPCLPLWPPSTRG